MNNVDAWQQSGAYANLMGHNIFYLDTGELEKPVIFLIHGFPTSSYDWADVWSELKQHYRLVALDMLGFGFSDKPYKHRYSIHQQADICEALLHHLQLTQYHVLAHDYGDSVAQELLYRDNKRASKQWLSGCLLNGGLFPETHYARPIQKILLSRIGPLVNKLSTKRTFDKSMTSVFGPKTPPSEQQLADFWQILTFNNGHKIAHKLMNYINDRKQHRERWVAALVEAHVPIALINGSDDPVSGRHMVARYQQLVGSDNIIELPTIGHYPQVESPTVVASHYLKFLASLANECTLETL